MVAYDEGNLKGKQILIRSELRIWSGVNLRQRWEVFQQKPGPVPVMGSYQGLHRTELGGSQRPSLRTAGGGATDWSREQRYSGRQSIVQL